MQASITNCPNFFQHFLDVNEVTIYIGPLTLDYFVHDHVSHG